MTESKAIILNVDHSLEGYVTIPKEQWEELLDFLEECEANLTHTFDDVTKH